MPVGEMLQRMTSMELTEWMAYYSLNSQPEKATTTAKDFFMTTFANRLKIKKKT